MQLFYNKDLQPSDNQFTFDKIESKHIVRVLRKKEGDILHITNGLGYLFTAKISVANDKKCLVSIISVEHKQKHWNYKLHIAIAPTKNIDRFEWFLEKVTEIGIDEITPIFCERSERKILKTDRLHRIIESAAKQSLKLNFPKLNKPLRFSSFISSELEGEKYIAHCEDDLSKNLLKNKKFKNNTVIILIGPEGDFSREEINNATRIGFNSVSLGKSRLRTETAGILAAHTLTLIK